MKKNNKNEAIANEAQTGKPVKKDMPVKNSVTDDIQNTALQTPGLNQDKTTSDDLFPSDGDNLTK